MCNEKTIRHEYTDEIVCPYCGYKFSDSWEYADGKEDIGLIECEECDRSFYANRNISITYSTEKANYGTCKGCKAENVIIEDYHSSIGSYNDLCFQCGNVEQYRLRREYLNVLKR